MGYSVAVDNAQRCKKPCFVVYFGVAACVGFFMERVARFLQCGFRDDGVVVSQRAVSEHIFILYRQPCGIGAVRLLHPGRQMEQNGDNFCVPNYYGIVSAGFVAGAGRSGAVFAGVIEDEPFHRLYPVSLNGFSCGYGPTDIQLSFHEMGLVNSAFPIAVAARHLHRADSSLQQLSHSYGAYTCRGGYGGAARFGSPVVFGCYHPGHNHDMGGRHDVWY